MSLSGLLVGGLVLCQQIIADDKDTRYAASTYTLTDGYEPPKKNSGDNALNNAYNRNYYGGGDNNNYGSGSNNYGGGSNNYGGAYSGAKSFNPYNSYDNFWKNNDFGYNSLRGVFGYGNGKYDDNGYDAYGQKEGHKDYQDDYDPNNAQYNDYSYKADGGSGYGGAANHGSEYAKADYGSGNVGGGYGSGKAGYDAYGQGSFYNGKGGVAQGVLKGSGGHGQAGGSDKSEYDAKDTQTLEYKLASYEKNTDGYKQDINYNGNEVWADEGVKAEGYTKGEDYKHGGYAGYDKEATYGGNALYKQDDLSTDYKVAYEVDHGLKYRNNYKDENHKGSYKGDEFDIGYKVNDVQGGYYGKETDGQYKAAAYDGAEYKSDQYKGGKYYGDDYMKYNEKSGDASYVEYGAIAGGLQGSRQGENYGSGGKDYGKDYSADRDNGYGYQKGGSGVYNGGMGNKGGNLYDKFKGEYGPESGSYGGDKSGNYGGDKSGNYGGDNRGMGNNGNSQGYKQGGGYGQGGYEGYYEKSMEYSKEGDYRGYGADYEGKDMYGKTHTNEGFAGAEEMTKNKIAYDKGDYRAVDAKGYNKAAQYQGDYQTNNKAHDVDYKVTHREDFTQDFNNDIKSDQYKAGYQGGDHKGGYSAENNFGAYKDYEVQTEVDKNLHKKNYEGESFSYGLSGETAGTFYDGKKTDNYDQKGDYAQKNQKGGYGGGYGGNAAGAYNGNAYNGGSYQGGNGGNRQAYGRYGRRLLNGARY